MYIPNKYKPTDMCDRAFKYNIYNMMYARNEFQTLEMCRIASIKDYSLIQNN